MNKFLWQLIAIGLIGFLVFACQQEKNNIQDGHLRLLSFNINYEGGYSELRPINDSPLIQADSKGLTTISVQRAEGCSFTREDFNGFIHLTKDTIFLYADYNWVGEARIGTMDACINTYIFKIANFPDGMPFKFVFD